MTTLGVPTVEVAVVDPGLRARLRGAATARPASFRWFGTQLEVQQIVDGLLVAARPCASQRLRCPPGFCGGWDHQQRADRSVGAHDMDGIGRAAPPEAVQPNLPSTGRDPAGRGRPGIHVIGHPVHGTPAVGQLGDEGWYLGNKVG